MLHFIITAQGNSLEDIHYVKTEATTGMYGLVIRRWSQIVNI
jgi:hypothetical protein